MSANQRPAHADISPLIGCHTETSSEPASRDAIPSHSFSGLGKKSNKYFLFIQPNTKYKHFYDKRSTRYPLTSTEDLRHFLWLLQHRQNKDCCCDESLENICELCYIVWPSWAASHSANALTQCVAPALPSIGATFGPGREFYRDDYSRHQLPATNPLRII